MLPATAYALGDGQARIGGHRCSCPAPIGDTDGPSQDGATREMMADDFGAGDEHDRSTPSAYNLDTLGHGSARDPIAIVGIGSRFPGGVDSPATLGTCCTRHNVVGDIPPQRFDARRLYDPRPGTPGRIMSRRGGFLDGIERFDPAAFGISPREAETMGPPAAPAPRSDLASLRRRRHTGWRPRWRQDRCLRRPVAARL